MHGSSLHRKFVHSLTLKMRPDLEAHWPSTWSSVPHIITPSSVLGLFWLRSTRPASSSPSRRAPSTCRTSIEVAIRPPHRCFQCMASQTSQRAAMSTWRTAPMERYQTKHNPTGGGMPFLPAIRHNGLVSPSCGPRRHDCHDTSTILRLGSPQVMYPWRAGRMTCQQHGLRKGSPCEPDSWPSTKC